MAIPLGTRLLVLVIFLASTLSLTQAQEKTAAPPPGVLESVPAKVAEFEKELTAKIDAARTVIDQEVAANRLKESVAQGLRGSLRSTTMSPAGIDVRGALATSRVPAENAAVAAAYKELETAWLGVQAKFTDLQRDVLADSRKQALEAIKTAKDPEHVDRLIEDVDRAHAILQRKFTWSPGGEVASNLTNTVSALRVLRRLMEAELSGNRRNLASVIGSLQNLGAMDRDGAIEGELRARVERIRAPYLAKQEEAQKALDAALEARKPIAEVRPLFEKYAEALEQTNELRTQYEQSTSGDYSADLGRYRAALEILATMEAKDYPAALQQISSARSTNASADQRRTPKLGPLLAKWDEQVQLEEAKYIKEQIESLRSRIQKVSVPDDLDNLIADVSRIEQRGPGGNRMGAVPAGLSASLNELASAWRSRNPEILREQRMQSGGAEDRQASLAVEVIALRRRVQREVMSAVLKLPELNQEPFAEKPLEAAVEELIRGFAQKKEWRRVLELTEGRRSVGGGEARRDTELTEALRSFLSGQNLELAAEWRDAAAAYKRVLMCTNELAPIADAAERLKVLKKEHPEIGEPPAGIPSTPPRPAK